MLSSLENMEIKIKPELERRSSKRINVRFAVRVRAVDAIGEAFRIDSFVDNISAECLYIRLTRAINAGSSAFVVVWLSDVPVARGLASRIAALAKVVRVDSLSDQTYGLALLFKRTRLL